MAGSKSNQLETDYLTWAFANPTAVPRPTVWYIGLFTDASGLANDQPSTEATGVNCPGYARQPITSWTITGNQAQNGNLATFTASGGAWATVRYVGAFDALTAGRLLYWASIGDQVLADTNKLDFPINSLTFNED